ncbi:UNVERIFIED_CONTAM: hypothetical protein NCL1_03898 [Trichonephila clavipes]
MVSEHIITFRNLMVTYTFLGMAETGGKSTDFRSPFGLEKFQSPAAVGSARQSHFKVRSALLRKLRENSQVHLSSKELIFHYLNILN